MFWIVLDLYVFLLKTVCSIVLRVTVLLIAESSFFPLLYTPKNSKAVREARMRLGTYKNISVNGMKKKAELLKQANAAMEANIAAGNNIKEALNLAIAGLGIKPAEEVLIKQQVMQQVADGTPMQFAVQQAIQENIQEIPQMSYQEEFVAEQVIPDMNDDILGSSLSGSMDIKSLLANL